jgi:hypothetical protein
MTPPELHAFIAQVLVDVRGDHPTPADEVLEDKAALVMERVVAFMNEVIGEDEPIEEVYEAWYHGKYPEPVYRFATGSVSGRNRLRAEQRQRAGLP